MWKVVEVKAGKVRIAKAEGKRKKRGRRKEAGRERIKRKEEDSRGQKGS